MRKFHNQELNNEVLEKLKKIKHVALDMDGTIYLGSTLFPYTKPFLSAMEENGIGYSFLTNNPSISVDDYLVKLDKLGIRATKDNVYTTALSAIDYIKTNYPEAQKLFYVGTPSMITEFEEAGFIAAKDDPKDKPDVLVVAFDKTLTYAKLCRAAWWAKQGVPFIATNPDRICPTDEETILVDCGSLCKCIEHATGRVPDAVVGKPDPRMLDGILHKWGLKPEETAMVGDRIYTDTAMAYNAGAFGVLVLSGETTIEIADAVAEDASTNPNPEFYPPDLIVKDIAELQYWLLKSQGK